MNLQPIRDALLTVGVPVHHFSACKGEKAPYLVWAEDSAGPDVHADGGLAEETLEGTVDYFTRQEYDPVYERVGPALEEIGAACYLNSIQYEADTGLIHYEWVWQYG